MLRGELVNPEDFDTYAHNRVGLEQICNEAGDGFFPTSLQALIKTQRDEEIVVIAEEANIGYVNPETSYEYASRNLFIASLALRGDNLYANVGPNIHFFDSFYTPLKGTRLLIFGQYSIDLGYFLDANTFTDFEPEMRFKMNSEESEDVAHQKIDSDIIPRRRGSVLISEWPQYGI